jgi:hypothetical protein
LAGCRTPVLTVPARIEISGHARERAKERLGLTGKAVEKAALKAYEDGLQPYDTTGTLKRYLDKLTITHGRGGLHIHADHIYVFERNLKRGLNLPWVLITILHLPQELRRAAIDAAKKRKREA